MKEGERKTMYIHEAVKKAKDENVGIAREGIYNKHGITIVIFPTDTYDACIVKKFDGKEKKLIHSCRNWNPTQTDLMADDWITIKV